jgi:hypothetical protein
MPDNRPYVNISQDEERDPSRFHPKLSIGYNSKKGWGGKFEGSENKQAISGYMPLSVGELNANVTRNRGSNTARVGYRVKIADLVNALRRR